MSETSPTQLSEKTRNRRVSPNTLRRLRARMDVMSSMPGARASWSLETEATDEAQTGAVPLLRLSPPSVPTQTEGEQLSPGLDLDSDLGPDLVLPRSSPVISRRIRPVGLSPNSNNGGSAERSGALTVRCPEDPAEVHTEPEYKRSPSVSPRNVFKSTCDLEQENVHFILVDLVLEVLEGAKWRLSSEEWTSERSFDECDEEEQTPGPEQRGFWETESEMKTLSVLSTDSGFEDCSKATMESPADTPLNAESLAQRLVQSFRRSWCPAQLHRGKKSLRSSLQELPGGACVVGSDLKEQIRRRTRMRGTRSWTPPSVQIILTAHHHVRRSEVVASQQFLCAGCGTELEARYIKKLRYCEYLGRYFCDCCHSGAEAVIPARVLSSWDFNRYPVSDFSKQLLDSVWSEPLFDLFAVGFALHRQARDLHRFIELHSELIGLQKLLRKCRCSERALKELEVLPAHLTLQPPLVSLADLFGLKKGLLLPQTRAALQSALQHALHCQWCRAQGFICGFCKDRNVLFSFQSDICKRCPGCKKSFHKLCFVDKTCPNCAGARSKRKRQDGSRK